MNDLIDLLFVRSNDFCQSRWITDIVPAKKQCLVEEEKLIQRDFKGEKTNNPEYSKMTRKKLDADERLKFSYKDP